MAPTAEWPPLPLAPSPYVPETAMTCHLAHHAAADPQGGSSPGAGARGGLAWAGWIPGRRWLGALVFAPLLLSAAPRSFLAHDEGYYALQARWISEGGHWLAPLWWGQPVFDRTIGVQWLIAGAYRLLGVHAWVAHLPSLVAAVACLALTAALARQLGAAPAVDGALGLGWLSALLLALTPLWINYAHLASQDMPLLALELLGLYALVRARPGASPLWALLAGLSVGPAFLIKGFMVAVPLVAIAPFLWLQRRQLLGRPALWLGLVLGWLPVLAWLGLSLREFGPEVVGGLVSKVLYLSESDVYSGGPFYYLWNIPANTAPWVLLALLGWWRLGRGRQLGGTQGRQQRLVLLLYPLLMLLLLSAFRTKTPYYGLQLTPMLAIAAAQVLQAWSQAGRARPRGLAWGLAGFGGLLAFAGLGLLWPGAPLALALQLDPAQLPGGLHPYGLAALALGGSWLLLPFGRRPRALLAAAVLGPWLALVLLVQAGLFSDRSGALRLALAEPAIVSALGQGPVAVLAPEPLSGEAHAQLILLALASPQLGPRLPSLEALPAGGLAWVQGVQAVRDQAPRVELVASGETLADWALVRKRP